jgi:hypothetical protein
MKISASVWNEPHDMHEAAEMLRLNGCEVAESEKGPYSWSKQHAWVKCDDGWHLVTGWSYDNHRHFVDFWLSEITSERPDI